MFFSLRLIRSLKCDNESLGRFVGTFQSWILQKLRKDQKFSTRPANDRNLDTAGRLLKGAELSKQPMNVAQVLASVDDMIRSLGPGKVYEAPSYRAAIRDLCGLFPKPPPPDPHHLLQAMYYASIAKKLPIARNLIRVTLDSLTNEGVTQFDEEEVAILCNALFRTSTIIPHHLLNSVVDRFTSNLESLFGKPDLFICFIKSLRHAEYHERGLLNSLSELIRKHPCSLKFEAQIHLLAYFCDASHSDLNFISDMLISLLSQLDSLIRQQKHCRLKDIDRILWAAAKYDIDVVKRKLNELQLAEYLEFLEYKNFRKNPERIVKSILWLWMLEYNKRTQLCSRFINETSIRHIKGISNFKDIGKLYLLLTCASIEVPNLLAHDLIKERDDKLSPRIDRYLDKRPKLYKMYKLVQQNSDKLDVSEVRCEFKIPNLYIGGLTAKTQRCLISIEVIDDSVRLHESQIPIGNMNLKLRLLKAQGIPTYIVNCSLEKESDQLVLSQLKTWIASLNVQ